MKKLLLVLLALMLLVPAAVGETARQDDLLLYLSFDEGEGATVQDLSDYIGEELYLELWDEEIIGSWAVAFFDEVITLYDEAPNYRENFDTMYNPAKKMDVQIKRQRTINKYMP